MLRTRLALATAVAALAVTAVTAVALLPAASGAAHSITATAAGISADNAQWG